MRLLVAEDEKRLNKIICEALEDEGYSVDACFDGEQALEYARAAEYDAMIMDIMMPRLDGLEAVRQMRSERICALARYVIADGLNPAMTACLQWFERTLDDSANKRIAVSEAFLATDAILNLYENVAANLVVHPKVIEKHVLEELPFMATENILMDAVKRGGDRQALHERIRTHALAAGQRVKGEGKDNDLLERIAADPAFGLSRQEVFRHLDPAAYIGCCPQQVERFLDQQVRPVLDRYPDALQGTGAEITV